MILLVVLFLIVAIVIITFIEKVKLAALAYYIVEKGYTEPTKEEMERCIEIAARKMVDEWFKK